MIRILLAVSLSIFSYLSCFSQTGNAKIEKIILSHCGDSLITQTYELIIKSKRIYWLTPIANYLDVDGVKRKTRLKVGKSDRQKIFSLVNDLDFTGFAQSKPNMDRASDYYIIQIRKADLSIENFKISDSALPSDFKKLYDAIIEATQ